MFTDKNKNLNNSQISNNMQVTVAQDILLAVADHADLQQVKERKQNRAAKVALTAGFQSFEQLVKNNVDLNESFQLTENIVESVVIAEKQTAQGNIVAQILDDFCSTPPSPSSAALEARLKLQETSPTFEFKQKPMRTYSRKRLQVAEQLVAQIEQDDDCLSTSSGLSVQEDLTQLEDANESADLNVTHKVLENLLNLSAYFSQQTDQSAEKAVMQSHSVENVAEIDLVEPNTDIKQINFDSSSQKLAEDLRVKCSRYLIKLETAANELSATDRDLLNAILKLRQQMPLNWEVLRNTAEVDQPLLGFSNENLELETSKAAPATLINTSEIEVKDEPSVFSDDECDDFFVNINTQEILKNNVRAEQQYETATIRTIESAEEQAKSKELAKLLAELPELDTNINSMNFNIASVPTFKTASSKNIKISKEAKRKAASILAEPIEADNVAQAAETRLESTTFPTFKTASSKHIEISEEAKKKAANILAELPELNEAENIPEVANIGFQTASSKSIKISKAAKARAANILADISEMLINDNGIVSDSSANAVLETANLSGIQFSEWPQANMETDPLPMLEMESSVISQNDLHNVSENSTSSVVNTKVIARKNLLSLRRKHKPNSNSNSEVLSKNLEITATSVADTTTKFLSQGNATLTPDTTLKFLSQQNLTVTPRMLDAPMSSTPLSVVNRPESPNVNNESLNTTQPNKSSTKKSNVKQRVERLRMYGDPPPISPIPHITPQGVNNCRPSGLRRSKRK